MNKRFRGQDGHQDFKHSYFNIAPDTEARTVYGAFTTHGDFDTTVINYIANKQSSQAPPLSYSLCEIDVNPDEANRGFQSTSPENSLFIALKKFTCVNAPRNISSTKKNNYFWLWESWGGTITDITSQVLWSNTMTKYTMAEGFYDSQLAIVDEMKKLNSGITFTFDKATQLLTYTGTKPLILPFSTGFDPDYYRLRPNITTSNAFGNVPNNVYNVKTPDASKNVFVSSINGQVVPLRYFDPAYMLDFLASYLGYTSGTSDDKIQVFFGYPQLSSVGDVSDPNITTPIFTDYFNNNGSGTISIVLYPGAKSGPGNIYGAMASCLLVSNQIATVIDGDNVLSRIDIAGQLARSQFHIEGTENYKRLNNGHSVLKRLSFQLKDLYQRDYELNVGPPTISVLVKSFADM
jgi:hypothetical protein